MAIIYNVDDDLDGEENEPLVEVLQAQTKPDGSPVFSPLTCLSLMVFYVFALQCVSTLVIVRRETNSWFWPGFQLVYMAVTAYLAALIVFQGGQWLGFT
jgi:ferrous iron transport protein B